MKFSIHGLCAAFLFFLCFTARSNAQGAQVKCSQSGNITNCRIDKPTVSKRRTEYDAIAFKPNDKILVNAGGCVQTGGSGATWKRFVNPSGPNSDRLYHGLISFPGRAEERIQGVIGHWIQLPPVIQPTMAFLVIGYEDDDYSDNGYWGHDDGTGDQCKQGTGRDGGPAWVTIQIDHGQGGTGGHPAAFDVFSTDFDPNGLPRNPAWQWEKDHPGTHPDPLALCAGFPYLNPSNTTLGVGFGTPPCTTQSPSVNGPSQGGFNDALCAYDATHGLLHGHLNWWPVTAAGTILWVDHKDWTQTGDDDYDFTLTPVSATGLTTNNSHVGGVATNPQVYVVEFDSDETVDHIDRGWWNDFHTAVDNNGGKSGGAPGAMIDGKEAIVLGLLGLDSEHGAYSELHPVYGMAIHVKDDPADDTWALLVRNWGDEGFCSQDEMAVPLSTLSLFLPRPGATGGTANTDQLFSNNDSTVSVLTEPGGAVVTLDLGQPESGTLVHGTVHFAWTMAPGPQPRPAIPIMHAAPGAIAAPGAAAAPGAVMTPGAIATFRTPEVEKHAPELRSAALLEQLSPQKKAEVAAKLRKPPVPKYTRPVRRVAQINVVRVAKPVLPKRLPAPAKAARDRQRVEALCAAYSGQIPGYPATICQAPR
jgi:hypothetical protein